METLLILIMLFIVLDIASLRWGFDSMEKINSPEWERRTAWHATYGKSASNKKEASLAISNDFLVGNHRTS